MKKIIAIAPVMMALLLASCGGGDSKFEKTENGLRYRYITHDEKGPTAKSGDIVMVHMVGRTDKDSAIFDTYANGQGPFQIPVKAPIYAGAIEEAFMMMAKGDSAQFKVVADSLFSKSFGQPLPPFITPGSDITFTLKMVDIMNMNQMEEKRKQESAAIKQRQDSLKAVFMTAPGYTATASGVRYQILKANPKGKMPVNGDSVTVHYTGMLLDGSVFDSSNDHGQPLGFTLGQHMMIPGWEEAMLLMRQGEKMRVFIPYELAYGERGAGDKIPPYANLLFELELISIN